MRVFCVGALFLFLAVAAGAQPFAGLALEAALVALQEQGLPLVFTSRLVRPEMRVTTEPTAAGGTAVLEELLRPHGLALRGGAGGRLLVVRATAEDRAAWEEAEHERAERRNPGYVVREIIDVTSRRDRILGEDAAQIRLEGEMVRALPALGDDALRGLTALPGTSGDDLSARFSVRGSRPDEVMITLDGLEIYEPYHLKDYRDALSVLAPETVGEMELLTGGFPVEYGDRMSGVLNVTTYDPGAFVTSLAVSVLNVGARSSGTWNDGRGGWLASLRGGSLELPLQAADEEDNPRFWDAFAKFEQELAAVGSLRGNVLLAGDRLDFAVFDDEEEVERFQTSYQSSYGWLTHELLRPNGLLVVSRGSASRVDRDRQGRTADDDELALRDERRLDALGVAQDWSRQRGPRHVLRWGADVRFLRVHYEYENSRRFDDENLLAELIGPGRESTTAFRDTRDGEQVGVYVADRLSAGPWNVDLGLRFDSNTVVDDDQQWSPRVQIRRAFGADADGATRFFAAWGLYHQSQRLYELQVEDGETSFVRAERAEHRSVGFEHGWRTSAFPLTLRAELYERRIRDPRVRWENLFEPISKVPELEADRVRIAPQSSLSQGLELFLSGSAGPRLDFFATYTWSSVEDRIDGRDVPRSIDQPHAVKLDFNWRAPRGFDLNLALRYHTGWPTTAILTAPEPALGPFYGERLPDYFRADLRVSRRFALKRGELRLFLDVQNLTDRDNLRGFDVNVEEEDDVPRVSTSANTWGPILPTLGVRWTFPVSHRNKPPSAATTATTARSR